MLVDVAYVCLWKRQIQYSILFVSHIIGSYICMYITRSFGSKNIALKCYNITKMIERSLASTQYTNINKKPPSLKNPPIPIQQTDRKFQNTRKAIF